MDDGILQRLARVELGLKGFDPRNFRNRLAALGQAMWGIDLPNVPDDETIDENYLVTFQVMSCSGTPLVGAYLWGQDGTKFYQGYTDANGMLELLITAHSGVFPRFSAWYPHFAILEFAIPGPGFGDDPIFVVVQLGGGWSTYDDATVTIDGAGVGAEAEVTIDPYPGGQITGIRIINGGANYFDGVASSVDSGSEVGRMQTTVDPATGEILSASFQGGGDFSSGATTAGPYTFSDRAPSAAAVASIDPAAGTGAITDLQVVDGARGFFNGDIRPVVGASGTGATAQLTVHNATGEVTRLDLHSGGVNYTFATLAINPAVAGVGSGAAGTATVDLTVKRIVALTLTNPGSGYFKGSVVVITGDGTGATATVTVDARTGTITAMTVVLPGTGYQQGEDVTIAGGGSGAAATGTVDTDTGAITGVTMTQGGTGYHQGTTVTVSSLTGQGAAATAAIDLATGAILGISIEPPGAGDLTPALDYAAPGEDFACDPDLDLPVQLDGTPLSDSNGVWTLGPLYGSRDLVRAGGAGSIATEAGVVSSGSFTYILGILFRSDTFDPFAPDYFMGTATVSGGAITSIAIQHIAVYADAPLVVIDDPPFGGVTATAHANLDARGSIVSFTIDNPGSGYTGSVVGVTLEGGQLKKVPFLQVIWLNRAVAGVPHPLKAVFPTPFDRTSLALYSRTDLFLYSARSVGGSNVTYTFDVTSDAATALGISVVTWDTNF